MKTFTIDLDQEPSTRYQHIVPEFNVTIWAFWEKYFARDPVLRGLLYALSWERGDETAELQGEIEGFAKAARLPLRFLQAIQMLNVLETVMVPIVNGSRPVLPSGYEALSRLPSRGGCLGIIATNSVDGTVYQARNLDMGPVDLFRSLVFNAVFERGGREVFRAQMMAGYMMVVTGAKFSGSDGFALARNTRYPDQPGGNAEMLHSLKTGVPLQGWTLRKILETENSYDAAVAAISRSPFASAEYVLVSGVRKGVVLSMNPSGVAHTQVLGGHHNFEQPPDYVIVSNFDFFWGDMREWFDPTAGGGFGRPSRRVAAQRILNSSMHTGITAEVLWNTISAPYVLATSKGDATIFQAVINVEKRFWNTSIPIISQAPPEDVGPNDASPKASVSSGSLHGTWMVGGAVAAFRNVPYASAARFDLPRPPIPWSGVRDATAFGPACKQHRPKPSNPDIPALQSEDCTRLNVFAPARALAQPNGTLPVMVWWHGGGFEEGSSQGPYHLYDGSILASKQGVVVVSCNYRLGIFGALVHSGGLDGNYGFLDQRACLQWVRSEVKAFGGDSARVTIWGQSSGAQSVLLHMASPGSAGLFHRAIAESAPDLSLFSSKEAAVLGAEVAHVLGCRNWTKQATIACLKAADADALVQAGKEASKSILTNLRTLSLKHPTSSILAFKPNIDGTLIVEQPMRTLLSGVAPAAVPTVIGFNHDEMYALLDLIPKWFHGIEVEAALALIFGVETARKAWMYYSQLYQGDDLSSLVKLLTDYLFTCSSQALALALPAPSYVYQYNHIDSFGPGLWRRFGLKACEQRACHMAEIPLVFGNTGPATFNVSFSSEEQAISSQLMGAFSAVAQGKGPGWMPFRAMNRSGLLINHTATPGPLGVASSVCGDIWDAAGYLH